MSQISNYQSTTIIPPGTYVQTLTGNSGGPVGPNGAGNINVIGSGNINIAGNAGTNTETVTLVGTTTNSLQIGNVSGSLTSLSVQHDGELPIGSTGNPPVISTLTAGAGISVTNAPGSITIAATGGTGTVTSIAGGNNITTTPNPITTTGTINLTGTTNHAVQVGNATGSLTSVAVGTTGQVLTGVTGGDPSFQAPAASSITITGDSGGGLTGNSFTFTGGTTGLVFTGAGTTETLGGTLVVSNGGTGRSTLVNHGLLVGAGTAAITQLADATNGQLPIGSTGVDPVLATLTAATGIAITNGAGSISLATTGAVALSFPTDSGTATPSAGALTIIAGISTQNAGATVEFTGATSIVTFNVTDANFNTIIGNGAGGAATSANATNTTALGYQAGHNINNAGATDNTLIGYQAGLAITNAHENVVIGSGALSSGNGSGNVIIGIDAGQTVSNNINVLIGYHAGRNISNSANTVAIGTNAGLAYGNGNDNNIVIGNQGSAPDSGVIRIGTNGTQTSCYITGIDGVNVASTAKVVTENADQLGTAVITAGSGISITPSANAITIASTATVFVWTVVTTNQTTVKSNGYFNNAGAGTITFLLPAAAAVGDTISIGQMNAGSNWQITQAAGQSIRLGTSLTTVGAGGSLTSTANGDGLTLVCNVTNTGWQAIPGFVGNITVV